jgi:hypothetical protein
MIDQSSLSLSLSLLCVDLHLDLEPRPNKYGHAAVWGLVPGYEKKDGTRNYPVAAMWVPERRLL